MHLRLRGNGRQMFVPEMATHEWGDASEGNGQNSRPDQTAEHIEQKKPEFFPVSDSQKAAKLSQDAIHSDTLFRKLL